VHLTDVADSSCIGMIEAACLRLSWSSPEVYNGLRQLHKRVHSSMNRRFLSAEWRNLVMLNYEIDPAVLQPLIPKGTELDAWNGRHFVSLVGFLFLHTRVLGVPIPFHQDFEEVNLRFYVRRKADDSWRRGVVFVKEIVPRRAIAAVARWVYNENYVSRPMSSVFRLPDQVRNSPGLVEYRWIGGTCENHLSAEFRGTPAYPTPGSEEEFITEHYWGYAGQRDGSCLEYQVEHPPWRVWRAFGQSLDCDVRAFYGEQYEEAFSHPPSSAFVAEGSKVVVLRGKKINGEKSFETGLPTIGKHPHATTPFPNRIASR